MDIKDYAFLPMQEAVSPAKGGTEPDPDACNDPTLCGYVVTLRGGSDRGMPDCPECLAILNAPLGRGVEHAYFLR